MKVLWDERAWEEYLEWQTQDKKTLKRINMLIRDIQRDCYVGIGKPEPLKNNLSGGGVGELTMLIELSIRKWMEQ